MSLSFKQIQDMLSTNLRLVGADIDAMRKDIGKIRLVVFQLMENQARMLQALQEKGIDINLEPIVEEQKQDAKETAPIE
jgi:ABC-type amino acid transport substrate-binding protein